jgi:hypothetical protein
MYGRTLRWKKNMKLSLPSIVFKIALAVVVTVGAWADDEVLPEESKGEPLSHLIEAIEILRTKKIPQAYFLLQSPHIPNSTIFFPNTNGGAFILIGRVIKIPEETDAKTRLAEITKSCPKSELPILDEKNNRLLYYSDESWMHLEKSLLPWKSQLKDIKKIAAANPFWEIEENDLVVKIPTENTEAFYSALMKAWKTNKKNFKCFASWN